MLAPDPHTHTVSIPIQHKTNRSMAKRLTDTSSVSGDVPLNVRDGRDFPEGTDLSVYGSEDLESVAQQLSSSAAQLATAKEARW